MWEVGHTMTFAKTYKLREIETTGELHIKVPSEFVNNYLGKLKENATLFTFLADNGDMLVVPERSDAAVVGETMYVFTGDTVKLRLRGATYFIRVPYMFKSLNAARGNDIDEVTIEMGDTAPALVYSAKKAKR